MKTTSYISYTAFALFTVGCFTFSPVAQAQLQPPPDGDYGRGNTAEGGSAMYHLDVSTFGGRDNTAIGFSTLFNVGASSANTAVGSRALYHTNGIGGNTAVGASAGFSNTGGAANVAVGVDTLRHNTVGNMNTAVGHSALFSNTASNNTANGSSALDHNSTGANNTASGSNALFNNSTGINNVALGYRAGYSLTTGSGNVCIGAWVLGVAGESNTTRIRNVYSSTATARAVYVNSDNKIGTLSSSCRYKEEIKPMDKDSEEILALKPVRFRYKKEVDPARMLSFGLIAEEVVQVNPDLVTGDDEGKPEAVRYEAINAMLLNEFLKEHRQVQEQQKEIDALKAELKEQKNLIEKVSARVELQTAPPQTVANTK